jgi:bisphosphoglycerate-dependent phosphoglycerate mutase
VAIELVFETHCTTVDNEQGRATGWLPGQLSEQGRLQAQQLGRRRGGDQITAVFSSDLARAAETASVAFAGSAIPVLLGINNAGTAVGFYNEKNGHSHAYELQQACTLLLMDGRADEGRAELATLGCQPPA